MKKGTTVIAGCLKFPQANCVDSDSLAMAGTDNQGLQDDPDTHRLINREKNITVNTTTAPVSGEPHNNTAS